MANLLNGDDIPAGLATTNATPATASVPSTGVSTPFCGDLRSKNFFMLDVIATEAAQYLDASGHCWCYHTQSVIGPDRNIVRPDRCGPGRSCYRSALAEPN
jgi:hypothetical protein